MNSRFALLALSIAIAVISLALVINVVGVTASNVSGEAFGIEANTVMESNIGNHPLVYQGLNINQDEPLSLTEPISIYLPLVSTVGYIDKSAERDALLALYKSTNGDAWINNTGWWTDTSYCEWYGVTCDENEHVTILDLDRNMLTGTIPSEIGDLPMLTVLQLTGTVIECNPNGCEYAQIYDPVASEIGNLAYLQELNLSENLLSTLPSEIGNLAYLQKLELLNNQLTSLPPEIGGLLNLESLDLRGNQLTSLPVEIGNLVNLLVLELSENQLVTLPSEVGNLVNVQELHLGVNQLTSIPAEISNLASLQVLDLFSNHLIGPVPAYLNNLGSLYFLALDWNPDLTCWETEEARDWALSLIYYLGPTCYIP